MHCYLVAAILGTCCVALDPASAPRLQESMVFRASATVDVVPGRPEVVVHLRNDSNVPLEAWDLRIEYDLVGGARNVTYPGTDTAPDEAEPGTPGRGPILPGETRHMHYLLQLAGEARTASVVIQMLLFEDGTVEGDTSHAKSVFVLRERHAEVLAIWIDALNAASGVSVQQARTVLERALASEARRMSAAPGTASGQSQYERITWLLGSPDDVLQSRIAEIKKRFERVREREMRHTFRQRDMHST